MLRLLCCDHRYRCGTRSSKNGTHSTGRKFLRAGLLHSVRRRLQSFRYTARKGRNCHLLRLSSAGKHTHLRAYGRRADNHPHGKSYLRAYGNVRVGSKSSGNAEQRIHSYVQPCRHGREAYLCRRIDSLRPERQRHSKSRGGRNASYLRH